MSIEFLINENTYGRVIHIHSDSLSSLLSIASTHVKSRTVYDTILLINALGANNVVSLQKVRSHAKEGTELYCPGNDYADGAARYGCKINHFSTGTFYATRTEMKNRIRSQRDNEWRLKWTRLPGHRQSKEFIQGPDSKIWKLIKKFQTKKVSNFVRFVTGFCHLRRHKVVITKRKRRHMADNDLDAVCRLCNLGPESPFHLLCICPRIMHRRHDYFSDGQILCYQLDRAPPISTKFIDFVQCPFIQNLDRIDPRNTSDNE